MSDNNMTDAEVLRQLDEANKYRDIIIDVLPRITQDAADDMSLRIRDYVAAQLAERDAEIAQLRQQVDAWQATGNAIMLCAVGREVPLSDSDVCGEINALRAQVAELQAWKDAVPVEAISRYFHNVSAVEEYAESRQDFAAIMSYLFPPVR